MFLRKRWQRVAAVAALAALPSGYCFGLSGFVSTLPALAGGLMGFRAVSVSAANTQMTIACSSKGNVVWGKQNAAAG